MNSNFNARTWKYLFFSQYSDSLPKDHQTIHEPRQERNTQSIRVFRGFRMHAEWFTVTNLTSWRLLDHIFLTTRHVQHSARVFLPAGSLVTVWSRVSKITAHTSSCCSTDQSRTSPDRQPEHNIEEQGEKDRLRTELWWPNRV